MLSRKPFGNYSLVTIGSKENHISFVAERSAYIHQIRLKGKDLLWNYPNGDALTKNEGHRNLALIPFPNRLLKGDYTWDNEAHKFPVNHPSSNSALHGFEDEAHFHLERVDMEGNAIGVRLAYLHKSQDHLTSYPFLALFTVALFVDTQASVARWTLSAKNLDSKAIPVGLGWHPYFLLEGGYEQNVLYMPDNQHVLLENAIPTGVKAAGLSSKQPNAIQTSWDDCFSLSNENERTVRIEGPSYSLSLKQLGATRYTQLYVPPNNGSLAVEPMSCGVNAFQENQSEVVLHPGAEISIGMEHQLSIH